MDDGHQGVLALPTRLPAATIALALLQGDFFLTSRFESSKAAPVLRILNLLSDTMSDSLSNPNSNPKETDANQKFLIFRTLSTMDHDQGHEHVRSYIPQRQMTDKGHLQYDLARTPFRHLITTKHRKPLRLTLVTMRHSFS